MHYDIQVFQFINNFAGQSKTLDNVGIFLADYLPYVLVAILICFLFVKNENKIKNRTMVFLGLFSAILGRFVIKNLITLFYKRPRPYIDLFNVHKLIPTSISDNFQSFPSGHTIFFFALSTVVYFYNKKLGIFLYICSVLVGLARIFVGVHWPSDIFGGIFLGILTGYGVYAIFSKQFLRQKI